MVASDADSVCVGVSDCVFGFVAVAACVVGILFAVEQDEVKGEFEFIWGT